MEPSIIVAILSLLGVITLGSLQFTVWKSQAKVNAKTEKKLEVDVASVLIDRAMSLNKEEYATLKDVNEKLRTEIDSLTTQLEKVQGALDECESSKRKEGK